MPNPLRRVVCKVPLVDPKIEHEVVLYLTDPFAPNSTTYVDISTMRRRIQLINIAQYSSPTFYYEVVVRGLSGNPTSVRLFNITDGLEVSGSVITESGTDYVRRRSNAITLSGSKQYKVQVKNDVTASTTVVLARAQVIVVNSASPLVKTEHFVPLVNAYGVTSSTSFIEWSSIIYRFEGDKFDGTLTIYFQVTGYVSAKTGEYCLYNNTDGVPVVTISTTSTEPVRIRSGAITLISGKEYIFLYRNTGGKYTYVGGAELIMYQERAEGITKAQVIKHTERAWSSNSLNYVGLEQRTYYDALNFDGFTYTVYHEAIIGTTLAGVVVYAILRNLTDGVNVDGSELSTSSEQFVRLRSGSISVLSPKEYDTFIKTSDVNGWCYIRGGRIIIDLTPYVPIVEKSAEETYPLTEEAVLPVNILIWKSDEETYPLIETGVPLNILIWKSAEELYALLEEGLVEASFVARGLRFPIKIRGSFQSKLSSDL